MKAKTAYSLFSLFLLGFLFFPTSIHAQAPFQQVNAEWSCNRTRCNIICDPNGRPFLYSLPGGIPQIFNFDFPQCNDVLFCIQQTPTSPWSVRFNPILTEPDPTRPGTLRQKRCHDPCNPWLCELSGGGSIAECVRPRMPIVVNPGEECDDGNPCTTGDVCEGGSCISGITPLICPSDANICTTDSCDPFAVSPRPRTPAVDYACRYIPILNCTPCQTDADCSDGNICNGRDFCNDGTCDVQPHPGCNDLLACTTDGCANPQATTFAASCGFAPAVELNPPRLAQCQTRVCEEPLGNFNTVNITDLRACDDGNACTINDRCTLNGCRGEISYNNPMLPSRCPRCGDRVLQTNIRDYLGQVVTEQCDDGNNQSGDGCSASCQREELACPTLVCTPEIVPFNPNPANRTQVQCTAMGGANWLTAHIECGGGIATLVTATNPSAPCPVNVLGTNTFLLTDVVGFFGGTNCGQAIVKSTVSCGDGIENQPTEACDEGANNFDTVSNACRTNCQLPFCGDGVIDAAEGCDDGNSIDNDTCRNNCSIPTCGDGVLQMIMGEECDDQNADNTDNCPTNCRKARCGDGFVRAGVEVCDDANNINTDACIDSCVLARCGDGFVYMGVEPCDDGNLIETDACKNNCTLAQCGDGIVRAGVEACDDGNATNTDACVNACVPARCGDGFVFNGTEACDDGNARNTDRCSNLCAINACFDEECNALDDDCDGEIDEGFGTTTCGVGACETTVNNCVEGKPQTCFPLASSTERCDGIDNNCDGMVDENCECRDGETRACGIDTGECAPGLQRCLEGRWSSTCEGTTGPSNENCDGLDNDCDGQIDEDLGQTTCGVGACQVTVDNCRAGIMQPCVPGDPSPEVCGDGLDNNCNGVADETCTPPPCQGPDLDADGFSDVCFVPTETCLVKGGKIEQMPNLDINDFIRSRTRRVQLDEEFTIDNGIVVGRCVQTKATVQFGGSSVFGKTGILEIIAMALLFAGLQTTRRIRTRRAVNRR